MTKESMGDAAARPGLLPSGSSPQAVSPPSGASIPIAWRPKTIVYGWGAPSLAEQLKCVGMRDDDIEHFQQDADALIRLHLRSVMSDGERDRAMRRLTKAIEKKISAALAQAIEARRAETAPAGSGEAESAVPEGDAPKDSAKDSGGLS